VTAPSAGPLTGVRVLDATTMGPGPFAAMMLADMGADVVRVERAAAVEFLDQPEVYVPHRNRRSIGLDFRSHAGRELFLRLIASVDCMIEGNRPGVMERYGLGPADCLAVNPRLVYGRMTGWGQDGPLAQSAGHDINYISVAGALSTFARAGEDPVPPANLVGDFGGGGMLLAFGVVCGLMETRLSGQGQVVDAAMLDGTAALLASTYGLRAAGHWNDAAGTNVLDTGAPFYDVYRTADGRHLSVGAIESKFYEQLLAGLEVAGDLPSREDPQSWPELRQIFAARFAERPLQEWIERFAGTDACVTPVLSLGEALHSEQAVARSTYVEVSGVSQPAVAPRFSRTPGQIRRPPVRPGADTRAVLAELGVAADDVDALYASGVVFGPT
jgi:alpha-methylacyl-CoA racemase